MHGGGAALLSGNAAIRNCTARFEGHLAGSSALGGGIMVSYARVELRDFTEISGCEVVSRGGQSAAGGGICAPPSRLPPPSAHLAADHSKGVCVGAAVSGVCEGCPDASLKLYDKVTIRSCRAYGGASNSAVLFLSPVATPKVSRATKK